jgi:hypothetical protein
MAAPLVENQISTGALIAIGAAVAVGIVLLTSRRAPATPAQPQPTFFPPAPGCNATQETLNQWAEGHRVTLAFLPRRRTPPTKSELAAFGFDVSDPRLVVVLPDTTFWTYRVDSDAPSPAPVLRGDYCTRVP